MSDRVRVRIVSEYPGLVISADGQIQGPGSCGKGPTWLKQMSDRNGYLRISVKLEGKWCRRGVHTLVCTAFHGPPPTPAHRVAHWNGVNTDNRVENLRWATAAENAADAIRLGEICRGTSHYKTHITEQDVRDIRTARALGIPLKVLSDRYGVLKPAISAITTRRTWRHVA